MVIRMSTEQGTLTVWLTGELDHHAARDVREQIDSAVERSSAKRLRLDFSGVTFMDSSGIAVVVQTARALARCGGTLYVVNTPPQAKFFF